jgi:hypothetical protein
VALSAGELNFDKFKPGGLHEKHAVATWNLGTISAPTTQRYIPEDRTLHNYRCENLKSYIRNIKFNENQLLSSCYMRTDKQKRQR